MIYLLLLVLFETGPIAILVQDEVRPGIQTSLDVYLADLANEGYRPIVVEVSKTDSCQIIRTILQGLYSSAGIEGAVLIGDIEVAKYLKFSLDYAYTDLYYMDLDGMWIDENGDGIFDLHTGNKEPEIWVGRLDCATLSFNGANQVDLLNAYLLRNHNYRSGVTHLSEKALIFLDDDDQSFGHDTIIPRYLDPVFWQKVLVSGHDSTDAEHYSTMLGYTYGLIWVGAHSVATAHYFTSDTGYSIFRSIQLPDIDPQTPFYFVDGCSTGGFESPDYLSGWYVFNPEGGGLLALAGTYGFTMVHSSIFFEVLGAGKTFGEALKEWYEKVGIISGNFYVNLLLGDPTLRLRREMARREVLFYDQAGDLDLTPDPGETLQVYVKLRNQTENQTITGITAKLSCGNGLITVLDSMAFYGDFAPGGERINSTPFRIAISPSAQRGLRIPIDTRISSTDGREWLTGFYLNIEKPYLTYFWQMWDDPDGNLDPGETSPLYVQILYDTLWASGDTGKVGACASNVRGILRSLDTAITVIDSIANYGIVSWGARAWPTDPFRLRASSGITQSPYPALLELELRTNEGEPQLDTFSITVGDYPYFYDDFESGAKGWLHEPLLPGWNDEWHLEDYRHNSGGWSWKCGGGADGGYGTLDGCILESPPVLIGENWAMILWYYVDVYKFEGIHDIPPCYSDGGFVEVNSGETWNLLEPVGGYPAMIYINSNNYGLHPKPGIGGSDYGWNSLIFPLNSLTGRNLQFRITFFSTEDGGYSKEGLYIDDFYVGPATGIAEGPKGRSFSLSVAPNPAKGKVKISFTVPDGVPYSLKLYDPAGRMVGVIHEGPGREGPGLTGEIHWEPDLRPGVYFLRLEAGGRALTEKMVIK